VTLSVDAMEQPGVLVGLIMAWTWTKVRRRQEAPSFEITFCPEGTQRSVVQTPNAFLSKEKPRAYPKERIYPETEYKVNFAFQREACGRKSTSRYPFFFILQYAKPDRARIRATEGRSRPGKLGL
jgi:hypothetical protein